MTFHGYFVYSQKERKKDVHFYIHQVNQVLIYT